MIINGNTTQYQYFNGSVAQFNNGSFFAFTVPPKSFYVTSDTRINPDGSFEISYSNGSYLYIGPPGNKNETAEQFAFRIIKIESFNGTKTVSWANGTIAKYRSDGTMSFVVKPTSLFVTRQAYL